VTKLVRRLVFSFLLLLLGTVSFSQSHTVTPEELASIEAKAQQGDQAAMVRAGEIYWGKQGIPADIAKGRMWLERAAEGGSIHARMFLGTAYMSGFGLPQDHAVAGRYLLQVAEAAQVDAEFKGSQALAQYFVFRMYELGMGLEKSHQNAIHFLELAAENGNYPAQFDLGSLYNDGTGGKPVDKALACSWWEKAADNGHHQAMHNVAFCYQMGLGGKTDRDRAIHYYTMAAEGGMVDSAHNLGVLYDKAGNADRAYFWLQVARAFGSSNEDEMIAKAQSCLLLEQRNQVDAELANWLEAHKPKTSGKATR
jgi:TPR repeat protein